VAAESIRIGGFPLESDETDLTTCPGAGERPPAMIMTRTRLIAASLILLGLAACQPETIDPNKEDRDNAAAAAKAAAQMPKLPMIASSKIYRCDDNSVANVDFMDDGVTANVKTGKDTMSKQLVAAEKGKPFTAADGYSLEGSGNKVKLATPGHKSQSCSAG
jgi:hypothetical protein